MTLIIAGVTLYFNVYRFIGYKISIGSDAITFVKSKEEFNKTYMEVQKEIKAKYKNVVVKNDFTIDKVKVDDASLFVSGDALKKIISKKFNIEVDAFVMKSDNKKVAYVINEKQGKEILSSIKDYYSKKIKLDNVTKIQIENNITYELGKTKITNLYSNSEIAKAIIKYNDKSKSPVIAVKVVGKVTKEEIIHPSTIIKSSNKLMSGTNQIQKIGINGIKKVTTEVICVNNNKQSQKVVLEEIKVPVQNKEILVGTNKPAIVEMANMNTPSRGSISSSFGMRWGKMHKGIDIAANLGAAIHAALDGSVIYAGWQEGYGNVIKIDHGKDIETTYAHCSNITVKKGEVVSKGSKIGEVGSTGNSTGPHLHFEVRRKGEPENPAKYIK